MDNGDFLHQLFSNTSGPIVNQSPSSYLSPSMAQLNAEEASSLTHNQDISAMSGIIHQLNNQEIFQQNSNFNYPVDLRAETGTGIQHEHFMTNNQISLSPHLHNYYTNNHITCDSQGVEPYLESTLLSMPPNLHDNQHAYTQLMLPEPHVSFGYDNQNNEFGSMEQGFMQLLAGSMEVADQRNGVHNQLVNAPNLEGHSPTMHERAGSRVMNSMIYDTAHHLLRPTMYPNHHTHLPELSGAHNLFGNHQYHSAPIIPNGYVEQGVGNTMQFSGRSSRVVYEGNEEQNQIMGGSNIQGHQGSTMYQTTTLPSNLTRNMGLFGITINDGISSQPLLSQTASLLRPERASSLQLHQVARVPTKRPTMWKNWKGKNGEEYQPPRRGRPRKRFEVGEASSCPKHHKTELTQKKNSHGIENGRTTSALEEANNTAENLRNEVQNSYPTNPSHAAATNPRVISNALYGETFEKISVGTDPHLRLLKSPPEN